MIRKQQMRFNLENIGEDKDVLKLFPQLAKIDSWKRYYSTKMSKNRVLRYVIFLYSNDSVLNENPPRLLEERMASAATMAGFPQDKEGNFSEDVNNLLFKLFEETHIVRDTVEVDEPENFDLDDSPKKGKAKKKKEVKEVVKPLEVQLIDIVMDFLIYQDNMLWMEILALERMYHQYIRIIMDDSSDVKDDKVLLDAQKVKGELMPKLKGIREQLNGYYEQFFTDHDALKKKVKEKKVIHSVVSRAK